MPTKKLSKPLNSKLIKKSNSSAKKVRNIETYLKELDIILLITFPVLATIVALTFKVNFLLNTLVFFGLPSVWFSFRAKEAIKRSALFALVITPPFMLVMDYIITTDLGWWDSTMFKSRLFGILPYEDFVWAYLQAYVIIIFYEHFLDKSIHKLVGIGFRKLIYIDVALLAIFFVILNQSPDLFVIPYAYFWVMTFFGLIPAILFLTRFSGLTSKFLKTSAYFFYLHIMFEFSALRLSNWEFPGKNYIGTIDFFGHIVPYEEIFAWWFLLAISTLCYYEFFDNDRK